MRHNELDMLDAIHATSAHECGHAIAARAVGLDVRRICTANDSGPWAGHVLIGSPAANDPDRVEKDLITLCGGIVGQSMAGGAADNLDGAELDLAEALARADPEKKRPGHAAAKLLIALHHAKEIIGQNWQTFTKATAAASASTRIEGTRLVAMLASVSPYTLADVRSPWLRLHETTRDYHAAAIDRAALRLAATVVVSFVIGAPVKTASLNPDNGKCRIVFETPPDRQQLLAIGMAGGVIEQWHNCRDRLPADISDFLGLACVKLPKAEDSELRIAAALARDAVLQRHFAVAKLGSDMANFDYTFPFERKEP